VVEATAKTTGKSGGIISTLKGCPNLFGKSSSTPSGCEPLLQKPVVFASFDHRLLSFSQPFRLARQNLPVSVGFGNNAYANCINQREPAPGAINPKGVMK